MKTNFLNFTNMKTTKLFFVALFCLTLAASCSDDDSPAPVNPEEVITDVNITFTNTANSNTVTLRAVSPDGEVAPTLTVIGGNFEAGATYDVTLTITDEVNDENILEEVVEEKDEHFFVYATTTSFTMVRAANDEVRTDGESLGLNTTWTAGAAGTGTITVQLVHEADTVDDAGGFGSATGGEFDINNTWNVVIQ